ncbi:S8 family serine peptidase [Gallaecimonas sp. GXIMD4217]|uniref:S8 family serine peptidase n=1 Tax=Gallaecimonas sp. GXIMD4217 TaxID=3131927 RepID=UPI00311B1FD4
MKLKSLTLATLAALYGAGVATSVLAASPGSETGAASSGHRVIEITDAIIQFNEDLRSGKSRAPGLDSRPQSNGRNVHRAIAVGEGSKVPFQYQDGLVGEQTWIVELSDKPVTLYQGGIGQLQATALSAQPSRRLGAAPKFDVNSSAVRDYRQYLSQKQDGILAEISAKVGGRLDVRRRYSLAFNGMALRLTQEQAARVAELPGVRNVSLEKVYELHTDTGPKHIGADGIWTGTASDMPYKGEGIVIGVLDTGINTDHASFADVGGDGYDHQLPARYDGYLGDCEKDEFAGLCNDKLIGVRSYEVITDTYSDPLYQPEVPWWQIEPKRPANGEDYNGHGSHTASTAGGNVLMDVDYVVPSVGETGDGNATGLKFETVSGVAPHANIIMYQVCYPGDGSYGDTNVGCPGAALLAGIEDAIADGVDVINYSIGSTFGSFPWEDPMELGFLAARAAGISVAASAGNSYSPQYSSQARGAIDHHSPWLTSVAATTHGREIVVEGKMLTGASGGDQPLADMNGAGISGEYTGPVVAAAAYGEEHTKCNEAFPAGFFDNAPDGTPFDVAPIVVCQRGDIARVAKAENVQAGGAGGFILYNTGSGDTLNNDAYVIPGIHIDSNSWQGGYDNGYFGLQDWLAAGSGHRLTITASDVRTAEGVADYVADFSSRGPNLTTPDVMSPNLAAPGVNIYAAWADEMPFSAFGAPADYAAISGTSMAAPHVAGAMALLRQAHPNWSPAQIQSALMTTASLAGVTRSRDGYPYDAVEAGYEDAGSGVINVARAVNAGLLLDETADNYRAANPRNGGNVHTLNLPYFYNGACAGTCTWMRTVTATQDGSWTVDGQPLAMEGAPMLEMEVSPKQFSLRAGESQVISVTAKILEVEALGADASQLLVQGAVTLTPQNDGLPLQHLPLGVRYSGDNLPQELSGAIHRQQGHLLTPELDTAEIQSFNYRVDGLAKGERFDLQLQRADNRDFRDTFRTVEELEAGNHKVLFFDVPEGTRRIVWEVLSADANAYTAVDMGMDLNGDGQIQWSDEALCYSWTDAGDYCAVNDPLPGRYWVTVGNYKWEYEDPKNLADDFSLALGIVTAGDSGNLSLEGPASTDGIIPYNVRLNYAAAGCPGRGRLLRHGRPGQRRLQQ